MSKSTDPPVKPEQKVARIGKYEVIKHIGTGGMGVVVKARDPSLNREVALKILPPEMAANPVMVQRFGQEARHAAKLRHENIVSVYDFVEDKGTFCLVLEFVDGIDLHEYINRKKKLDPEEARQITIQAAKALYHAHKHGIVHRDIKPSNFLLTRKKGKLIVKLADFGLAREENDEEFKMTRSGTTVGTVDYMAPEQARNSRMADIRSDIYSLGCTLFHMLTGQAPFPEGGLTERLYKHVECVPPDVRDFNPKVPGGLLAILGRMLNKKPEDRYQTPKDLLMELMGVQGTKAAGEQRDVLADLALAANEKPSASSGARPRPPPSPPAVPTTRRRFDGRLPASAAESEPFLEAQKKSLLLALGGVAVAVLVLAVAGIILVKKSGSGGGDANPGPRRPGPGEVSGGPTAPSIPANKPPSDDPAKATAANNPTVASQPGVPRLYPLSTPVDAAAKWGEFEAKWPANAPPADTPIHRVSRIPRAARSELSRQFDSLAGACNAALPGRLTIIEIADNGPIFETGFEAEGKQLLLRAAQGFRPLLVWDTAAIAKEKTANFTFLKITRGSLTLEDLDVVLKGPDAATTEPAFLIDAIDSDFQARGCTFSVACKQRAGVELVRLETTVAAEPRKCRLSRCFARGANLTALDVRAPGAEVLIERSLLVGGEPPLIQIAGRQAPATTVRIVRSTLVAFKTLFRVQPVPGETTPTVQWFGWDALLARSNTETGGELIELSPDTNGGGLHWNALNCLYTGWKTLLGGSDAIAASNVQAWRQRWQLPEGDAAHGTAWPAVMHSDPAEVMPEAFRTADTPAYFAATAGSGALGCDLAELPPPRPARDNWLALTYERVLSPPLDLLADTGPPDIPKAADGVYAGERIDLSKLDLGQHLQQIQQTKTLEKMVVLRLFSSAVGRVAKPSQPIHLKGVNLFLYFEPADDKNDTGEPLVLTADGRTGAKNGGFIELEDGSLAIVGGELRLPDYKLALMPPYLIKVQGGDVRLHHCRLQGPLSVPPENFRGLINFQASGETAFEKARGLAADETLFVSGRDVLRVNGVGARVHLNNCVVLAGQDGLSVDPGAAAKSPLNVQCVLTQNTFAARRAAIHVAEAPQLTGVPDPLVIQARGNLFLDPFLRPAKAGLLLLSGAALARGELLWQGDKNAYDKRLVSYAASDTDANEPEQTYAVWARLWGTPGDRKALTNPIVSGTLDLGQLQLAQFNVLTVTPPPRSSDLLPGADLLQLGILKKKPKTSK
jgi:serine/threonine protein kinase